MKKQLFLACLGFFVCLCLSGCGSGSVSGKVTYNGKPLNGGNVIFMDKEGHVTAPAYIKEDGTYTATNVPTGSMKVIVDNPPPPGYGQEPDPAKLNDPEIKASIEAAKKYMPIPQKYKDPEKSGKTIEIKSGSNEYNIELEGPLEAPAIVNPKIKT